MSLVAAASPPVAARPAASGSPDYSDNSPLVPLVQLGIAVVNVIVDGFVGLDLANACCGHPIDARLTDYSYDCASVYAIYFCVVGASDLVNDVIVHAAV